ncbi:MAG: cation:proton antiporter, partial [Geminicoccaceae bacterium]
SMDIVTSGLLALAASFALIGLLVPLAERLKLPLPTVVAVVGLGIGSLAAFFGITLIDLTQGTYDAKFFDNLTFDSENLLFIFLPPLLFEMALAVDVRRLMEDLAAVMLMAVVAVITATAFVGGALVTVSSLDPVVCLLFGATISTTDPAAVVTIFRKLGAPKRLLVILEGESLLNDAAAIALFTILVASLSLDQPIGIGAATSAFLYAFVFGALSGFVLAQIAASLYRLLQGSALAETSLTVALAYSAFLTAELVFAASGVVAVVVAGLTTVVVGTVRMGPRNWPAVTGVWSQIGFWANGLILLIGALIAPQFLVELDLVELGYLVVVVIAAFAARAVVLFGMLPAISGLGFSTSLSQRQKTLVWWGGVRGAVTLILTLSLAETTTLDESVRADLGVLGCGFVLFTLLVNAATLARVTHWLGLDKLSKGDQRLRERIVVATMENALGHVADLAERRGIDPDLLKDIEQAYGERVRDADHLENDDAAPFGERLKLGLTILASQERRLFRRRFEDGVIGVTTTRLLQTNADRLADATRLRGRRGYQKTMADLLAFPRLFRPALQLQRWIGLERPLARMLARRFDVLVESESALQALCLFNAERMAPLIGEDATENLKELLDKRASLIRSGLDALELQYPHYAKDLRVAALHRAGLRWEEARYGRLLRDGVVSEELHRALTGDAQHRIQTSRKRPRLDMGLEPKALLGTVPLFQPLSDKDTAWLARRLKSRLVAPGDTVVAKGDRGYEMYFIASGVVEVRVEPAPIKLKTGQFFGELALMHPARRRNADVVALGFCRLLVLRQRDFKKLVAKNSDVASKIEKAAASRVPAHQQHRFTRRRLVS